MRIDQKDVQDLKDRLWNVVESQSYRMGGLAIAECVVFLCMLQEDPRSKMKDFKRHLDDVLRQKLKEENGKV